jgi:hypothetical protein
MFHSVYKPGRTVADQKDIDGDQFQSVIRTAELLGFETITSKQLIEFLEENAYIPPRSMIMIVDDRRPGVLDKHFMPILTRNNWTVTAAYITDPSVYSWAWEWMDRLFESGHLDVQSHGYSGQVYIVEDTPEDVIWDEITSSIHVIEERFGERPIAFIWPGGNFTLLSVEIAREAGFRLGFTAYSRGPLLFNWIPLGEEETSINVPLMVLPRAWSISAEFNLSNAAQIGDQALDYAIENYPVESEWYRDYCHGELPHLSTIIQLTPTP